MSPSWTNYLPIVAAVSGATATAAHATGVPLRKSLSFGPQLPHAGFNTQPQVSPASLKWSNDEKTAFKYAEEYVQAALGHPEGSFRIRPDSYFDATTGIWHVYLRQVLHDGAFEVTDGDINLNIRNGQVLSYGDSFYRGPAPSLSETAFKKSSAAQKQGSHDQYHYCSMLREALTSQLASDAQLPMTTAAAPISRRLTQLYEHNCVSLHALDPAHFKPTSTADLGDIVEAKDAALYFVVAAHPNSKKAQSILENFSSHRDEVSSHFETHLHGSPMPVEVLTNVPGTEAPVKATLAYVQSPCSEESACAEGQTSELSLVWRLEVELNDNSYEAYVDALLPTRIKSVLDWVSDYSPHAETSDCWPGSASDSVAPIPKRPDGEDSVYKLWPWGVNDPQEGERDIVKSPYDKTASPIGWHSIPSKHNPQSDSSYLTGSGNGLLKKKGHRGGDEDDEPKDKVCHFTTTWGNNVQAQENWEGRNAWLRNGRPEGNANLTFVYPYGAGKSHDGETVNPKSYIDLAVAQLFYTNNMIHDLYYRYGFDEVAGNFQNYNFGKGGKDDDGVIANAQDGSGFNNANFLTPPDGTRGRMRMYVWDTASPYRDGDLEAGIVIHEYSHGLSTRLTGGPSNSGCLGWGEAGGMGEGWGDFLATTIRSTSNYTDFAMGAWAANREKGIRNYKYSLNMTTNPSTYKTLDGPGYWGVHAIGEVWAQLLWVVSQGLIEKHGFSDTLFPPQPNSDGTYDYPNDFYNPPITKGGAPIPKHGNTLMVQLVLNGMKLQPCRPSFFTARNAILQADEILTGGENVCDIWTAFSSRGLGPFASLKGGTPWGGGIRKNGFDLPEKCGGKAPGDGDEDED